MTVLARPFRNWSTYEGHGGIDYGQPRGTGVPASGPGVIDFSGYYSERGGWAKFIQYDCGCRHGYYHFDREQGMGVGQRVDYGTIFAYVGGTGLYSTGPHLHHEVWDGHSSIIKPPAYWNYVDANHYVGDGSTAGDGSEEFDMPLTDADVIRILDAKFVVTGADGKAQEVAVKQALGFAVLGHQAATAAPGLVWKQPLVHAVTGKATQAGELLRYEPAEHANTRTAIAGITVDPTPVVDAVRDALANIPGIDPAVVEKAAQAGAEAALRGLTLKAI